MQESKEIGPLVTTKQELDALYKNKETGEEKDKNTNILSDKEEK